MVLKRKPHGAEGKEDGNPGGQNSLSMCIEVAPELGRLKAKVVRKKVVSFL